MPEQLPDITCDVDVPRSESTTGIPAAWINDREVSFTVKGLAAHVVSYPRGTVGSGADLGRGLLPDDPSPDELVAEMVKAGYLVRGGDGGYRLVHPDRLPPLP